MITSPKAHAGNNNTKAVFVEEISKSLLFQAACTLPLLTEILSRSIGSLSFYKTSPGGS